MLKVASVQLSNSGELKTAKSLLHRDSDSSSSSSVGSGEEIILTLPGDSNIHKNSGAPVLKHRFSSSGSSIDDAASGSPKHVNRFSSGSGSGSAGGFGENKSVDHASPSKTRRKYSSSNSFDDNQKSDAERRRNFQKGGSNSHSGSNSNSNSFVKRSLSSQNHMHNNSAARLGDLVMDEDKLKPAAEIFRLDNMDAFDDLFGEWLEKHAKMKPLELHETYPADHLDTETSLDEYIVETLRRSSEIEYRLGQLEGKMPKPQGIRSIRKLLHSKNKTMKKLRDRKSGAIPLTARQLDKLRDELHVLRNQCLEAVDRERVGLRDPEHVLQQEFDLIANL